MKTSTFIAVLLFSALFLSTTMFEEVQAIKKKLIKALLVSQLFGKKLVVLPLPLFL
ncbi:hypothetical protein X975_13245, partial [Stegodyphus mimosarum]